MRSIIWLPWLVGFVAAVLWSSHSSAEIDLISDQTADGTRFIIVEGEFEADYRTDKLVEAVRNHNPKVMGFNSPGGNLYSAMAVGRTIRSLGLDTIQPRSSECASACALAFLGGVQRFAEPGSIGVHQSSFSGTDWSPDEAVSAVQYATADVINYLIEMGVDPGLLKLSLQYGSNDMRYLSSSEMADLRVTTIEGDNFKDRDPDTASTESVPDRPGSPVFREPQSERRSRIAIYDGLDFYGSDIASGTVADAGSCAAECVAQAEQCRAFTYNTSERARKGPNCFLKSNRGSFQDANKEAISGLMFRESESRPGSFSISAIDPIADIMKDVDIPGNDLRKSQAGNLHACRIDCLQDNQCRAFTFVAARSACWLKSSGNGAIYRDGMTSAYKRHMTFKPDRIITP
ncbi:PAN domain-containing protein [Aurantimonas sp. E1-2-R+4]|uniref:PAN domain-containing protein n=1 Tax=Aurantimonas sp. E1-2-R+4 TaxID=3113714 RepID=UPI002F94155C